jgi:hypothetical protein
MLKSGFLVLTLLLIMIGNAVAQTDAEGRTSRFLFLPFDSSSAGKYTYLADGVRTMLASRLAAKDGVQLVDYAMQESEVKKLEAAGRGEGDARVDFSGLQADYLVSGALYATNIGLKIQVVVSAVDSADKQQNFSTTAENEEQVIPAIGTLSEEIYSKILRTPATAGSQQAAVQDDSGVVGFRTEHPEKEYKKGLFGGGSIVGSEGSDIAVTAKGLKKSSTIPVVIVAMDVGDLDGDGEQEIVFASRTALEIFHYNDGRFQKIGDYRLRPTFKIHALNIADLDKDGKSEIYISANERFRVSSQIVKWSAGEGVRILHENIAWFLRPILLPGEGMILAGQTGSNQAGKGFVEPGIYRLEIAGSRASVRRGAKLPLPGSLNLFDFVRADLDGDGTVETVAIDRNEKLLVYDNQNNLLWVSEGNFGGSRNYLGPVKGEENLGEPTGVKSEKGLNRDMVFVPTRLLVQDIDNDRKQEILIGRNKRNSPRFLRNYREYDGGDIACLSWRESELKEVWHTSTIPGYISDYSFILPPAGTPKDSRKTNAQLYVGQVPGGTFLSFLAAKESRMLVYEIELPKP